MTFEPLQFLPKENKGILLVDNSTCEHSGLLDEENPYLANYIDDTCDAYEEPGNLHEVRNENLLVDVYQVFIYLVLQFLILDGIALAVVNVH